MTSRNFGRLVNASIERFNRRQNVNGNNNFPLAEPHPQLIQSTTEATLLARSSDYKQSELQRLHDRIMTADCNGRLIGFVDEQQRWVHCTLHHDDNNQPLDTSLRGSIDGQVRRFVHDLAPHRSPIDVCKEVSSVFPAPAWKYAQTYY
ncbi:hypothetical protein DM01DRAFT_1349384 [Hesseltinella vesiculosa]|uniref:Uncharacterized protein n=1 Tax=Hesseltinella vesiculosa TaxID=101127 RepID=A0A1X2G5D7_9FUNG|nr:hypothetical protein DM01DRAFT_1349384 [Hesseltinella vesiculosa]